MKPIIQVENLSKLYYLGQHSQASASPGGAFINAATSSLRMLARRRRLAEARPFWALKDLSFEVRRGEIVGIIGRNGAGKSTLLKILARVTKPTSGAADIYGRVGCLLEVGTGFHPDLSGRENIYLNGAILGMKREEIARKFDEIVDFAESGDFLDTPVKHYSSGMYLRLAFAVAAHLEPEILLLDEVLAVGDAAFQKKCLGKMQEVSRAGRTILFVSHNMAAVQQMCERVLLLDSGKLRDEGTPAAVIAHYLSDASQEEHGDFDLANHSARLPDCAPVIRRLRLSAEGSPSASARFHPGQKMIVELLLEPAAVIREPRVAISIEDHVGQRITTVASYFQNDRLPDIERPCRVRCALPVRLGSGRYLLSVSIANKYQGMIDGLHHAAWFEVVWRNNFDNGEAYDPVYGATLTPSTWELS
ncbi:MAG TPA: ABC transporter ATP-binding protein [Pyrinomonadaceae bacterium]|nr:ABC transporter ATP-binding protein [Pyrinomonadaceae bacterium]